MGGQLAACDWRVLEGHLAACDWPGLVGRMAACDWGLGGTCPDVVGRDSGLARRSGCQARICIGRSGRWCHCRPGIGMGGHRWWLQTEGGG